MEHCDTVHTVHTLVFLRGVEWPQKPVLVAAFPKRLFDWAIMAVVFVAEQSFWPFSDCEYSRNSNMGFLIWVRVVVRPLYFFSEFRRLLGLQDLHGYMKKKKNKKKLFWEVFDLGHILGPIIYFIKSRPESRHIWGFCI